MIPLILKPTGQASQICDRLPYRLALRDRTFKIDQYFQTFYWMTWDTAKNCVVKLFKYIIIGSNNIETFITRALSHMVIIRIWLALVKASNYINIVYVWLLTTLKLSESSRYHFFLNCDCYINFLILTRHTIWEIYLSFDK